MRSKLIFVSAFLLLLAGCGGSAPSASPGDSITEVTSQQSLDDLTKAAKEEGDVTWYTSIPSERANQIGSMFKKKYGIEVLVLRSGGSDILQKFLLEEEAGRVKNDVLTITDPAAFINLKAEDKLTCFKPGAFDSVPDYAKDPDGCWIASRVNAYVIAYNTKKITDPPTSFDDLADPRFADELGYVNPNFSSGALVATAALAKYKGWDWVEKLAESGLLVVKGNNQLMQSVVTGERGIASFVNSTYVSEAKAAGQPIEWVFPEDGMLMLPAPSAVVAGAPNPSAGKLLANFLLTDEVQHVMVEDGNYAAIKQLPAPEGQPKAEDIKKMEVDFDELAKTGSTVRDKFNSIVEKAK